MKANQHTAEEIIRILAQTDQGTQTVGEVCREHAIAETCAGYLRHPFV